MRKPFIASVLALSGLLGAGTGFAQTESAVDKAIDAIPIEKIIGQLLGSIDVNALSAGMEQAGKDVAAGKQPDLSNNPALQDMQSKLQKQIAMVGPDLMKTMLAVMRPLLAEIKSELTREPGTEAAQAR